MRKTVLVALTLAVAVCATAVWSQGDRRPGGGQGGQGGPGGRMGGFRMTCPAMAVMPIQGPMVDRMSSALSLTKDQVAKLKTAAAASEKIIEPLVKKAGDATKALRTALLAPRYDAKKVKDLAKKAEAAEARVVNARIDAWTKMRAVLKPDQVKKLQNMTGRRPGGGQRPNGPPPGGGGPPPPPGR